MSETINCGGAEVEHNSQAWQTMTNRHPTTRGRAWGWIEGAPGNVCWSNDPGSKFTSADARRVTTEHNTWLERQTPLALRITKQEEACARAAKRHAQAVATEQRCAKDVAAEHAKLVTLQAEQGRASR